MLALVFAGLPLAALVYLLVTSDPDNATWLRLVAHGVIAVLAVWLLVASLPDAGLLIAIAAVVALTGVTTTALFAKRLLSNRAGPE